jgi:hypothetical protein
MSNVISQKEAVFLAVSSVFSEANVIVPEGGNYADSLTREFRAQVTSILVEGFNDGTIALEKTFADAAALRTYCSGLTSNWVRKDSRLNGGMKYVAKNPGSRVGSADTQLKAMRALLKTQDDESKRAEIQGFIDARVAAIKVSKKPTAAPINADDLPEELRHLI